MSTSFRDVCRKLMPLCLPKHDYRKKGRSSFAKEIRLAMRDSISPITWRIIIISCLKSDENLHEVYNWSTTIFSLLIAACFSASQASKRIKPCLLFKLLFLRCNRFIFCYLLICKIKRWYQIMGDAFVTQNKAMFSSTPKNK